MISLEKAKDLKEAGLVWAPQTGDWFSELVFMGERINTVIGDGFEFDDEEDENSNDHVWLPRLDQILAAIEARGYQWKLYKNAMRFKTGYYDIAIYKGSCESVYHTPFAADTPEDATSDALLWLLGQEQSESAQGR